MSVLDFIVRSRGLQAEPVATQALAHIMKQREIAEKFLALLHDQAGIQFGYGSIHPEMKHGDSIPDLTIKDQDGNVRVLVENKFWAGLTDAQPIQYLEALPEDLNSALLFIVPKARMTTVWHELKKRCDEKGFEHESHKENTNTYSCNIGSKFMLVTNWENVFEILLSAAESGGHVTVHHDILQLQYLTEQEDHSRFLPIRSDEVTDQETAHRLINYADLISDITDKLVQNDVFSRKGLRPSHSWTCIGRYLKAYDRFGFWFGISLDLWRDNGKTPLWWNSNCGDNWSGIEGYHRDVANLIPGLIVNDSHKHINVPIFLLAGEEKDRVIEHAVNQMHDIADKFNEFASKLV